MGARLHMDNREVVPVIESRKVIDDLIASQSVVGPGKRLILQLAPGSYCEVWTGKISWIEDSVPTRLSPSPRELRTRVGISLIVLLVFTLYVVARQLQLIEKVGLC